MPPCHRSTLVLKMACVASWTVWSGFAGRGGVGRSLRIFPARSWCFAALPVWSSWGYAPFPFCTCLAIEAISPSLFTAAILVFLGILFWFHVHSDIPIQNFHHANPTGPYLFRRSSSALTACPFCETSHSFRVREFLIRPIGACPFLRPGESYRCKTGIVAAQGAGACVRAGVVAMPVFLVFL